MEQLPVVNSHNHWDKLEEVIVGVPYHIDYDNDLTFKLFFYLNIRRVFKGENYATSNQNKDEALEDLEGLIDILKGESIIIRRPELLTESKMTKTPWWDAPLCHAMMSRDLTIVIGNEIIETSPQVRSRYFEGDLYKEIFTDYFNRGAKWTVAPRSRLLDRNFDYKFFQNMGYSDVVPEDCFYEIMFDGAQILRFGRDLFFNCSLENHRMGMQWLQRNLGSDYRVHELNITDNHIDSLILPLKPGVLLVNRRVKENMLPVQFKYWEKIWYTPIDKSVDADTVYLASESVDMNVLSLDEKKIVVQDMQKELIKDLKSFGFEPIPCRWRQGRKLGGGFHCVTLDVRRRSKLESYF